MDRPSLCRHLIQSRACQTRLIRTIQLRRSDVAVDPVQHLAFRLRLWLHLPQLRLPEVTRVSIGTHSRYRRQQRLRPEMMQVGVD